MNELVDAPDELPPPDTVARLVSDLGAQVVEERPREYRISRCPRSNVANPQEQQMQMLQQIQKMQQDMQTAQEELANARVEATVGGGVVKATVTGSGELVAISIDPECRRSRRRRDARGSRARRRHRGEPASS